MNDFAAGEAGTIVLVHGLWVTPRSWEGWKQHYEARGYRVLTPAWPGIDREVEELRRDPSGIAGVGLREVVDHYPGRSHFIIGQDGWQEVADYALNWAEEHAFARV